MSGGSGDGSSKSRSGTVNDLDRVPLSPPAHSVIIRPFVVESENKKKLFLSIICLAPNKK